MSGAGFDKLVRGMQQSNKVGESPTEKPSGSGVNQDPLPARSGLTLPPVPGLGVKKEHFGRLALLKELTPKGVENLNNHLGIHGEMSIQELPGSTELRRALNEVSGVKQEQSLAPKGVENLNNHLGIHGEMSIQAIPGSTKLRRALNEISGGKHVIKKKPAAPE